MLNDTEGVKLQAYIIIFDIPTQILVARGVKIVGHDCTALFSSGDSEWANASENIHEDLAGFKQLNDTVMFSVKPRIPVYARKIERKTTVGLMLW